MKRSENRKAGQMRALKITRRYLVHPEGSVLIEMGRTKVICTASIENTVPRFLKGTGNGWITAEYQMLPRSTETRMRREVKSGPGGRTMEIQRLIGRALRTVVDLEKLGERTIYMDCDVIQADGGTRTASITGGCVALLDALSTIVKSGVIDENCIKQYVAAISVGIVEGNVVLDLDYPEDSQADVDMNIVMSDKGEFIELQSTAERNTFNDKELTKMIKYGKDGIKKLIVEQKKILKIR